MRFRLFIFLFFTVTWAQAQVHSLKITERVADDKISKSLAILPVYKFTGLSIEPYTMFGIEDKPQQSDLVITRMPDMTGCSDTGYTYVFFGGANSDANQGYLLTLIGNYRRSMRPVLFYIDRNNNLDLSDDGAPDTLKYADSELFITLHNLSNREATYQVKLSRIEYGENIPYKKLLTDHYEKHSGRKKFTNINYCYREQRFNTVSGVYRSDTDSFRLALKDLNNNGIFNESCTDRFYIGALAEQVQTDIMTYVQPDLTDMFFEWNKKRYRILSISPTGEEIRFEELKEVQLKKGLKIGKKIPEFSFVNLDNQREESRAFRKKPVYLFFWDFENLKDADTSYLAKLQRDFGEQIHILTFNHGDEPNQVRKMRYYDEIKWPMAFSSVFLSRLFFLENLPNGFYAGKKMKLKAEGISPERMYEILQDIDKGK